MQVAVYTINLKALLYRLRDWCSGDGSVCFKVVLRQVRQPGCTHSLHHPYNLRTNNLIRYFYGKQILLTDNYD